MATKDKSLSVSSKNIVANAYEEAVVSNVTVKETFGSITPRESYNTYYALNLNVNLENYSQLYIPIPGIFNFYQDSISYSESYNKHFTKNINKNIFFSETFKFEYTKYLDENVTITEILTKDYNKDIFESANISEIVYALKQDYFLEDYIESDFVGIIYSISGSISPPPSLNTVLDPNYANSLGVISNNGLTYTWNWVGSYGVAYGTIAKNSGKQYFEVINEVAGGYGGSIYDNWAFNAGVSTSERAIGNDTIVGLTANSWGFSNSNDTGSDITVSTFHNNIITLYYDTQRVAQGEALGVAVDFDTGKIWFSIDGRWLYDQDPDLGGEPHLTFTPNITLYPAVGVGSRDPFQSSTLNAGSLPFMGVKPAGFESWNSSVGVAN